MSNIIPRNLIKHLEWTPGSSPPVPPSPPRNPPARASAGSPNFSFNDETDFWRMTGVPYNGLIYTVELLKNLLDGGKSKKQAEWTNYTEEAMGKGEFGTPDYPLQHALFATLFRNKDNIDYKDGIEQARTWLDKAAHDKWLMTLTRIKYKPSGIDEIIHNHGLSNARSIELPFVGPGEFVKDAADMAVYHALLGAEDSKKDIRGIYKWLTGIEPYIYRINAKPERLDQRGARSYADTGRSLLNCNRDPDGRNSSLGVRVAP